MIDVMAMSEDEFAAFLDSPDRRGLRRSIGGSQVGALIGVSKYKTAADVWDDLMDARPEQDFGKHLQRGVAMEPLICQMYAEETGRKLGLGSTTYREVGRGRAVLHAMPDRLIENGGILEVKCPDTFAFEATLANGIDPSYYAQLQFYMMIEQATWGAFAIFNVQRWELHKFDVERDLRLQTQMWHACDKFWTEHVLTRQRPEGGMSDLPDVELPVRLGAEAKLLTDEGHRGIVAVFKEAKMKFDEAKTQFEFMKERVQEVMKEVDAEVVECDGLKVFWKESTHRTLSKDKMLAAGIDPTPFYTLTVSRSFRPIFGRSRE